MISLISLLKESQSTPKALILAGAPGAGKGSVLNKLNLKGIKILNLDNTILALSKKEKFTLNQKDTDYENRSKFMKAMSSASKQLKDTDIPNTMTNKESFILDGTSASFKQTNQLYSDLKEAGYEVMMLYVYTDLETSLKRNENRFEKSKGEDRSLMPSAIFKTWYDVTKNFEPYQKLFNNFVSVSNTGEDETLKDIKQILQKYIVPFRPKDGVEKSEKQITRSKIAAEKLRKEMQDFLNSDQTKNIINSSVSVEEAQQQIIQFFR